jgi:3-oxoacyl-[acyl-carrier protein] reductase
MQKKSLNMTYDFNEKRILVTGGSRGIGREISKAFANCGGRVAINFCSDKVAAQNTLESLNGAGHIIVQADISTSKGAKEAVEKTVNELGGLDILVNNAGIGIYHPIVNTGFDEWQTAWRKTIDTNLIGPSNVSYCAAHHMIDNGGGRIVNISSRGAFRGEPNQPAYGASKAGLNALSQSLAIALAPYNIFVGVVAPGFVETDLAAERLAGPEGDAIRAQSPLGRVARPEEVAKAVLFLASAGAEFTTGTIIDVNGASYLRS